MKKQRCENVQKYANIEMSIFKFKKCKKKTASESPQFLIQQCNNGDVSLLNELGVWVLEKCAIG